MVTLKSEAWGVSPRMVFACGGFTSYQLRLSGVGVRERGSVPRPQHTLAPPEDEPDYATFRFFPGARAVWAAACKSWAHLGPGVQAFRPPFRVYGAGV